MNDSLDNKPANTPEPEPVVSKTVHENTIAPTEPISNDTALTEAERMYKQGLGDNSHTDKKPA